jgi:integrase
MASLRRKDGSPYWFACFTLPNGKQTQRSTKEVNQRKALAIAHEFERATRIARTERQARRVIDSLYEIIRGEKLERSAVGPFLQQWVVDKSHETASATHARYKKAIEQFIAVLGPKAEIDIREISQRDVLAFRNALTKRVTTSTANLAVKIVRMALRHAMNLNLVDSNVAVGIRPAKDGTRGASRRAFTLSEMKRLLAKAKGEWRGMILFGFYAAGQRLMDVATITWQNIDLERGEISFVTRKTGRRQIIPLAPPLEKYLSSLPSVDKPKTPIFPKAAAITRSGTLSNQFYEILSDAGLVPVRTHQKARNGRAAKRAFNELGFHSLRHTATSVMKNAGISSAIVEDIVGHDSSAVSAHYTHIDEEAKRTAITAMPNLE